MDERGLGKRLQAARQAAGLTQQQLCHQANLSFSTLTKIERGAIKSPSIFTIQSIAGALHLGLDELVGQPPAIRKSLTTKDGASFIYFDVNGCLVHYVQRAFASIAAETGASPEAIESVYWHNNTDVCRGVMSLNDFNTKLAERIGVDSVKWQEHYLKVVEPIKEMQEILKWASESYRIGLLTNTMPGLLSGLLDDGKLPKLDYETIVDSSEVGVTKPDAEIYKIAQERAGVPGSEILFIDDARDNVMAAERLGWQVKYFDDALTDESSERVRDALQPAES
jgi:FMN phosphatase YigB (HAD superfamily)